jgi:hypothetical protein
MGDVTRGHTVILWRQPDWITANRQLARRPGSPTRSIEGVPMNNIIYIVGLVVVVMLILSFIGFR